ncbi:MAG TPA: hypothetical protein VK964_18595 [Nocardioidaceae bacterium]|nr:hypothetical protein [Nocardioidaceae bacterium]
MGAAQAGAYDRAIELLRGVVATSADEPGELSARALAALGAVLVHGVRGSDEEAISLVHVRSRWPRTVVPEPWLCRPPTSSVSSGTGIGRLSLLRRELGPARTALESACATARALAWTSFLAFPQSLLAEVDLLEGRARGGRGACRALLRARLRGR